MVRGGRGSAGEYVIFKNEAALARL